MIKPIDRPIFDIMFDLQCAENHIRLHGAFIDKSYQWGEPLEFTSADINFRHPVLVKLKEGYPTFSQFWERLKGYPLENLYKQSSK